MAVPGLGFVLVVGTALAGILYLMYRTGTENSNQYDYQGQSRNYRGYREPQEFHNSSEVPRREQEPRKKKHLCSICLNHLEINIRTLDCAHSFHEHCINTWLRIQSTCPMCRYPNKSC